MITDHVHISKGVTKLGAAIPSVSLPPVLSCRQDAPCYSKCYARKGRFAFSHNKSLLQRNLDIWNEDRDSFERDVTIAAFHSRFFRWHSAGDIPDEAYLDMMVRVAKQLTNTKFLCFTKKYEMVNDYLKNHKMFPANLSIVLSAWGSFVPDNPFNLPIAYVRFKHEQTEIPPSAFQCSNYCGDCVMSGCSCWDLKSGQSVCFNEH
ncbi:MAG: hypothetical protein IJ418_16550 [Clostridia bacterium]|nr:hypothetical protein [Clostridia bacterium]